MRRNEDKLLTAQHKPHDMVLRLQKGVKPSRHQHHWQHDSQDNCHMLAENCLQSMK
jgi:hypothetical protein